MDLSMTGTKTDCVLILQGFCGPYYTGPAMALTASGQRITAVQVDPSTFGGVTSYTLAFVDLSGNKIADYGDLFFNAGSYLLTGLGSSIDVSGGTNAVPTDLEWQYIVMAASKNWSIAANGSPRAISVSGLTGDDAAANGNYYYDSGYNQFIHSTPGTAAIYWENMLQNWMLQVVGSPGVDLYSNEQGTLAGPTGTPVTYSDGGDNTASVEWGE
jgi:hypothetical protein